MRRSTKHGFDVTFIDIAMSYCKGTSVKEIMSVTKNDITYVELT